MKPDLGEELKDKTEAPAARFVEVEKVQNDGFGYMEMHGLGVGTRER